MTKTYGNIILMAVICTVIFWILMALRPAHAQVLLGDPYDAARCAQYRTAPPNVFFRTPPNPFCGYAYAPLPPAIAPPPPPPVEGPPPISDYASAPPPPPLGWVWGRYAPCGNPACDVLIVSVGVDGLNIRVVPDGPVIAALANGTPVIPLTKSGPWVLVAPACPLGPTWTASITAGGIPLSVCM
jgi:hypothetical protein